MSDLTGRILAMYDIRGIQDYIFKTVNIKDAIGASSIVEDIIERALESAVNDEGLPKDRVSLEWHTASGPIEFSGDKALNCDVYVLYIGGGNAYVMYQNRETALKINKKMSVFVLKNTYSLQLATAMVDVTGNYSTDYKRLNSEMSAVKAKMEKSGPLGALPVMEIELKTGYPVTEKDGSDKMSTETVLKKKRDVEVRKNKAVEDKILDSYVTKKGVDSTIAVVHIDGNNMGLRIRNLIKDKQDYAEAVSLMRSISFNINSSYKNVYYDMERHFNDNSEVRGKSNNKFVMKVLTAGDDITYVCNGAVALDTVEYFSKKISKKGLYGADNEADLKKYGFSVCAGVAYISSHYPFYSGYETAEACCESAKKRAKDPRNMKDGRIGSWVDFQICKNIGSGNIESVRKKEYLTAESIQLMLRPYYISTDVDKELYENTEMHFAYENLKRNIEFFANTENIPRNFVKQLRNLYSDGESLMKQFVSFLNSRNWKLPEGTDDVYVKIAGKSFAKYYDALEILDLAASEEHQDE